MVKKTHRIGAHVSAAGGLSFAVERALSIGADCMQIFGASPRQWAARMPDATEVERYKARLGESGIAPVFLHAAYLVNCASPDPATVAKSIRSLTDHLRIAEMIGSQGLIFHLGSGKEMPKKKAIAQTIRAMRTILKNVAGETQLIMENSAGGGQKIGATLEDIAILLRGVRSPRVKVCLDTAHAFEAGVIPTYTAAAVRSFFDALEKTIGMKHLTVIHANDSRTLANSHHDQHENIGEGHIGREGFCALGKEKRLRDIPFILEVQGFADAGPDKKNVDRLRTCLQEGAKIPSFKKVTASGGIPLHYD